MWQPISTAPGDGTPVDLWVRHFDADIRPHRVCDMVLVDDRVWRRALGNVLMERLADVLTPTHWMPQPDPPKQN